VDGMSFEQIEERGLEAWQAGLREELSRMSHSHEEPAASPSPALDLVLEVTGEWHNGGPARRRGRAHGLRRGRAAAARSISTSRGEGRISVVKRRHGLSRCRGESGMKRWVGLGVIADKLISMGNAMAKQAHQSGP
jgi:hypothetical protein